VITALQKDGWFLQKEQVMIDYSEDRSPLWADLQISKGQGPEKKLILDWSVTG
jgi:hypothetical protein